MNQFQLMVNAAEPMSLFDGFDLIDALNGAICDPRFQPLVVHEQRTLLAQRIFALAAGYEDLNDHQTLRTDTLLASLTDRHLKAGQKPDDPLSSPPTLCRLENRLTRSDLVRMSRVLVETFIASHDTPPEELVVSGGLFHGVQLWVNLPAKDKMIAPKYQGLAADEVVLLSSGDGGSLMRVIAGEVGGHQGPGSTHTPMALVHASVSPGAMMELPWNPNFNALAYVLAGSGWAGSETRPVDAGQLVAFGPGDWISVRASDRQDSRTVHLELLILGGEPIREPVEHYGPFVMNTRDEIMRALEDFEAGLFGEIPANALMPHVPDPNPIRAEHTGI